MSQEQITTLSQLIADYLIPFIVAIVSIFIVPPIKSWLEDKNLMSYVMIAVKAAEQIFEKGQNNEKYQYVKDYVAQRYNITEEALETVIEAAVLEVNKQNKKTIKE